jgi:hypothetical protein
MIGRMRGAHEMIEKLRQIAAKFPDRVAAALYQEAQIEMTEAKRRTPVDTGTLRASGQVAQPARSGRNISVTLSFGGAAADYAIYVHENLEAHHRVGQAKFLESTLDESAPHMAARIAARVQLNEAA